MQREEDDEVWRAIVANYGDRADLDPDEPPTRERRPEAEAATEETPDDRGQGGSAADGSGPHDLGKADGQPFEPPEPPPLPVVSHDRLVAWLGVFGSPTVLLVSLLVGFALPTWLGYLLVAGFVGGFLYLVMQMPRGPRDPSDDGARL